MGWFNPGKVLTGYTAVVVAQGPSALEEDVRKIECIYPTIAIKDTFRWAPNAVIVYACDRRWWFDRWKQNDGIQEHKGIRVVLDYQKMLTHVPELHFLKCGGNHGFNFESGYVCHGRNSGHQGINLTANLGPNKIILIGFDMMVLDGKTHCAAAIDRHVKVPHSVFDNFYGMMVEAAPLLAARNIKVVNTSLRSRLQCFPKMPLDEAIEWGKYAS